MYAPPPAIPALFRGEAPVSAPNHRVCIASFGKEGETEAQDGGELLRPPGQSEGSGLDPSVPRSPFFSCLVPLTCVCFLCLFVPR